MTKIVELKSLLGTLTSITKKSPPKQKKGTADEEVDLTDEIEVEVSCVTPPEWLNLENVTNENLATTVTPPEWLNLENVTNENLATKANAESDFRKIFVKAVKIGTEFGVEPTIPRRVGSQIHRDNYPGATPEEYFRTSIFVPFVDDLRASLIVNSSDNLSILIIKYIQITQLPRY
ncbi:hypothetical protein QE152_g15417 [Popillia japonica]|uniref:Uncharacterized protein n=1 Tax=Popillia japonica TaxID=7064 RepID=A0AAW1L8L1_POPJA